MNRRSRSPKRKNDKVYSYMKEYTAISINESSDMMNLCIQRSINVTPVINIILTDVSAQMDPVRILPKRVLYKFFTFDGERFVTTEHLRYDELNYVRGWMLRNSKPGFSIKHLIHLFESMCVHSVQNTQNGLNTPIDIMYLACGESPVNILPEEIIRVKKLNLSMHLIALTDLPYAMSVIAMVTNGLVVKSCSYEIRHDINSIIIKHVYESPDEVTVIHKGNAYKVEPFKRGFNRNCIEAPVGSTIQILEDNIMKTLVVRSIRKNRLDLVIGRRRINEWLNVMIDLSRLYYPWMGNIEQRVMDLLRLRFPFIDRLAYELLCWRLWNESREFAEVQTALLNGRIPPNVVMSHLGTL